MKAKIVLQSRLILRITRIINLTPLPVTKGYGKTTNTEFPTTQTTTMCTTNY